MVSKIDPNILTMDTWSERERKRYCPFDVCMDTCSFKGSACSIQNTLKKEHKTFERKYDAAFVNKV